MMATFFLAWAWQTVHWHAPEEPAIVACDQTARKWNSNQPLKVLSYNVQFMASKNYFFFYDGGPDRKPENAHVSWTIKQVAEVILKTRPDIVLLQEINGKNDSRTHYRNQLQELQAELASEAFPCAAETDYWRAGFVLHPKIFGSVDMKLGILSRYTLDKVKRYQLPRAEGNPFYQRFYFQRAIMEARINDNDNRAIAILNTHFDAWTGGSDLSKRQVEATLNLLNRLEAQNTPWILGGDFNILPPDNGIQYSRLSIAERTRYNPNSELAAVFQRFHSVPDIKSLVNENPEKWYTYFPNDPSVVSPDRTIDYIFYSSQWQRHSGQVVQKNTLDISDHLPLTATFQLH